MSGILRLIAGGLLALIACYVGILIKRHYKDRTDFFASACDYVKTLISELSYKKTPIPELAAKFAAGRSGEFERALTESIALLKKGESYAAISENLRVNALRPDEKKEVVSFFTEINKSSLDDQLACCEHFKNVFEGKKAKCEADAKRLGGMYFKLCVLLGLAIILILA